MVDNASKNLDEVAKLSNKFNNAVSTYKEALLTPAPMQYRKALDPYQKDLADPRITREHL